MNFIVNMDISTCWTTTQSYTCGWNNRRTPTRRCPESEDTPFEPWVCACLNSTLLGKEYDPRHEHVHAVVFPCRDCDERCKDGIHRVQHVPDEIRCDDVVRGVSGEHVIVAERERWAHFTHPRFSCWKLCHDVRHGTRGIHERQCH